MNQKKLNKMMADFNHSYKGCFFEYNKDKGKFVEPYIPNIPNNKNEIDKDYLYYLYTKNSGVIMPTSWFIGKIHLKSDVQVVISRNDNIFGAMTILNTMIGDKYASMEISAPSLMLAVHDLHERTERFEIQLNKIKEELCLKSLTPIIVKKDLFNEDLRSQVIAYQNNLEYLTTLDMKLSEYDNFKRVHLEESDIKMHSMFNYSKYDKECVTFMFTKEDNINIEKNQFESFLKTFFEINTNVNYISIVAPPYIKEMFRDFINK